MSARPDLRPDWRARWAEARTALLAPSSLRALVEELAPGGHHSGPTYVPRNPTRLDRSPGSFVIWTAGPGAGAWIDYATGDKGDVFGLIGYILGLSPREQLEWAEARCGLGPAMQADPTRQAARQAEIAERVARREAEIARKEAEDEAERGRKEGRAMGWWLSAAPVDGTPADVYLRQRRAISAARLPRLPGCLRWDGQARMRRRDGTIHHGAMLAAMSRYDQARALESRKGGIVAVHRTFLTAEGRKAGPDAKKMWGSKRGAAVRLSKGASGLTPEAAARALAGLDVEEAEAKGILGTLAISEGIEDGLSVAILKPGWRVWAAGDLGNIGQQPWPICASRIVLIGQNDDHPETLAAFERAHDGLQRQAAGRPLIVWRPTGAKDANELLAGAASNGLESDHAE